MLPSEHLFILFIKDFSLNIFIFLRCFVVVLENFLQPEGSNTETSFDIVMLFWSLVVFVVVFNVVVFVNCCCCCIYLYGPVLTTGEHETRLGEGPASSSQTNLHVKKCSEKRNALSVPTK